MNFFKTVTAAVSQASKAAAESAKKTYAEMKAPPSHVRCSACPNEVEVPPTAFDWTCQAGHINKRADELCIECKIAQPSNLPEPTVTCPSCQAVTSVPLSNARKHAREAARNTKEFAVQTAAATKATVEHLRAAPTTFNCAHCNTLLAVPAGPWACQTCTEVNAEDEKQCKQCGQKKTEQKAICGVCRQSTVIPSTNFVNSLKHTVKDVSKSGRKAYYDAAGKPYVTCNKCTFHVPVPANQVSKTGPAAPAANIQAEGANPEGGLSSPPPAGEGAAYNGESLICPSCKNPLDM